MLASPDSGHENVPIILGSVDLMCYRQSTSVKRIGHAIAQKTKHHQKKDRLAVSRPIGEEGVSPSSRIGRTKKENAPRTCARARLVPRRLSEAVPPNRLHSDY